MIRKHKKGKDSKFALAVHAAVRHGTLKAVDTAKLLKLHKKQDKFALNYLKKYTTKLTYLKIWGKIKQGKARVKIRRKGYSFLISGRDLLPVLISKDLPSNKLNKEIEKRFFEEKYNNFSNRAWKVIPEYIGPHIAADRRIKSLLTLALFSDVKINIIDKSRLSKKLVSHAKTLGSLNVRSLNRKVKSYELNIKIKTPKLGKFKNIAESASKVVHLREGDISFIKKYIKEARKKKVKIPNKLEKKFRKDSLIELSKASARMELRSEVINKDVERIKQLSL